MPTDLNSSFFRRLAAATIGLFVVSVAAAQTPIGLVTAHGIAFDSLHGVPLAGAFITIAASKRSATSDARGRFVFDSLLPGVYTFWMQHDALDSGGLSGATTRAEIRDGRDTIRLSVPSFATLWRAACHSAPPQRDSGLVFGTIRLASGMRPPAGAAVSASWLDVGYDKATGITQHRWRLGAVADSMGNYALCGAPTTTAIRVRAATDSAATGLIDLMPLDHERIARRDFLLGRPSGLDSSARGAVAGMVTGAGGKPLADALVIAEGIPEVRTSADGRFMIRGVSAGTQQIEVRAIGLAPVYKSVDVVAHDTTRLDVQLEKVTLLDSVRVTANGVRQRLVQEINDRRVMGSGHFKDSTEVSKHPLLLSVFEDMPSVTVKNGKIYLPGSGSQKLKGPCVASLWIDGKKAMDPSNSNAPDQGELKFLSTREIAMIEVYPRMFDTPIHYVNRGPDKGMCGTILIWTKRIVP